MEGCCSPADTGIGIGPAAAADSSRWWPPERLHRAAASPPGHRLAGMWPLALRRQSRRAEPEAAADSMRHPNREPHQFRYLDDHGDGEQDSHMDLHSTA